MPSTAAAVARSRPRRRCAAVLAAPLSSALALAGAAASAQSPWVHRQVSAEGLAASDVVHAARTFAVSPDGEWIVYAHDPDVAGSYALWARRRYGGAAVRLSGALPPGTAWSGRFTITPDSRRVIYELEQETLGEPELYSVPIGGPTAAAVKLNPELDPGNLVSFHYLSQDGSRVVMGLRYPQAAAQLYSAPVAGPAGTAIPLDGPLVAGGDLSLFMGTIPGRIFFIADAETLGKEELWTAPIDTPNARVRLSPPLPASGDVANEVVRLSDDATRIYFSADATVDDRNDLYVAPADGSGPATLLSGTMVAAGDIERVDEVVAAGRVVFRADRDTDGKSELYSVPWDGSAAPVKLNPALIAAGDVEWAVSTTADGQTAVFRADWAVDGRLETFRVPIAGPSSAAEPVSPTLAAGESMGGAGMVPVDGGERLVQYVQVVADERITEFLSCPLDTAPAGCVQLNPAAGDGTLVAAAFTDGYFVFAQGVAGDDVDLYTVPVDGSAPANDIDNALWGPAPTYDQFVVDPRGELVLLRVALDPGELQLFRTRADGTQSVPRRVHPAAPVAGGSVHRALYTADGYGIVYAGDLEVNGKDELYVADERLFAADFDEEGDTSEWTP